ncbi:MAG: TolC family protein [Opitutaceae bacterium]
MNKHSPRRPEVPIRCPHDGPRSILASWIATGLLLIPAVVFADEVQLPEAPEELPIVGLDTIVRLTFEHNLKVTAARYDVDASEFQFLRYERNVSQFRPLILESGITRDLESEIIAGDRREEYEDVGRVAVGMEKEFFDGTRIGGSTGYRSTWDQDQTNRNPFVEFAGRFPLFSSFTRLERVTERSFEESEMLGSWLDFIETVRDTISESHQTYFELQSLLAVQSVAQSAYDDIEALLGESQGLKPERDLSQMRDQLQAYQSRLVERKGDIAAKRIELLDRIGLNALPLEKIEVLDLYSDRFHGGQYLASSPAEVLEQALGNDVEMQVMKTARDNARLKISLAERGKWDIIGHIFGSYDFDSHGDNPSRQRAYQAGIAFSIERNDPKLLMLSLRRAQAEERKFTALAKYRERQLENEIDRRFGQATNLRGVVRELKLSRDSRRAVFEEKRSAYLESDESLDNVLRARGELFSTEQDLLDTLDDFFEVIVDLDVASGAYYAQLEDELARLSNLGDPAGRKDSSEQEVRNP